MQQLYQISIKEVHDFIRDNKWALNEGVINKFSQNQEKIKDHLVSKFKQYTNKANLDGESIKQLFFPTDIANRFNLFISHSSDDADTVEQFAKTLEVYGYHCFVDWMVWGNIKDLQPILDDNLCHPVKKENGGTSYNYALRNYTTAHTHAMLSMALLDMINKCDICLFITSENSTLPNANFGNISTLSSWIYEEITYMNTIAEIQGIKTFSENKRYVRISHPLDLRRFKELTSKSILPSFKMLND